MLLRKETAGLQKWQNRRHDVITLLIGGMIMRFHTENTLLLVIDFQEKLMPAIARHEEILERSVMLSS